MKLPLALSSCCAIVYAVSAAATDVYRDTTDHAAYVIKFNPAYNASSAHAFLASKHNEFMVSMASGGDVSYQAADTNTPILMDSIHMGDSFFTMTGALDDQFVKLLHQDDAIEFIESDNVYTTTLTRSIPVEKRSMHYKAVSPNWGLARIRQRELSDLSIYDYADDEGHGVDVFVLDSGVHVEHPDFEGRAFTSSNFVKEEEDTDFAGHGTHVAGKVAGKVYGVAKAANIQSVKILNKTGDGKLSTMLKGLSHVVQAATPGKAVVNLSLSGPPSRVMNAAIRSLVQEHNIPVFVSAGNAGADACNFSPSSSPDVFVIGATDITDRVASYSNTGPCVNMYAPGTDIVSTWIGGGEHGNVKSLDGTSMASPHVVGIAASLLSRQSFESPKQLYSLLTELGTKNVIAFPDNSAGPENNIMAFVTAEE